MIPNQWYVILFPTPGTTGSATTCTSWWPSCPIDDANTLLYLRYYQRSVTAPMLRQAFNFLGTVGNLVIERQDKRVVITQEPKRADLDIGETLIPGDGPIIQYRRRRRQLIEQAAAPAA